MTSTARPCCSGRERPSSWRADFTGLLEAMDALPLTVRLLNPPLHEFPRDRAELMVRFERRGAGERVDDDVHLLAAVNRLSEPNAILGRRGVRLGLAVPGLFPLLELTQ
jgi:pyruvate, orthophosphate dikinase